MSLTADEGAVTEHPEVTWSTALISHHFLDASGQQVHTLSEVCCHHQGDLCLPATESRTMKQAMTHLR